MDLLIFDLDGTLVDSARDLMGTLNFILAREGTPALPVEKAHSLLGAGALAILSPLPLAATVAMFALELLVACLQAFVFSVLTCVYLRDALHPGH